MTKIKPTGADLKTLQEVACEGCDLVKAIIAFAERFEPPESTILQALAEAAWDHFDSVLNYAEGADQRG